MNKKILVLSIALIVLGVVEIVIAAAGVQIPLPVAVVLGVLFIALGLKSLADIRKKQ